MKLANFIRGFFDLIAEAVNRCHDFLAVDFEDELEPLKRLQGELVILVRESTPTVHVGLLNKIHPFNGYDGARIDFVDYTGANPVSLVDVSNYIIMPFTPQVYVHLLGMNQMDRIHYVIRSGLHWKCIFGVDRSEIEPPLVVKENNRQDQEKELRNLRRFSESRPQATRTHYNWDVGSSGMSDVMKSL